MSIDITPYPPLPTHGPPGPVCGRPPHGVGGGAWGDINIHIDINVNIDNHIIINMNIEDYERYYLLLMRYSLLAGPNQQYKGRVDRSLPELDEKPLKYKGRAVSCQAVEHSKGMTTISDRQ